MSCDDSFPMKEFCRFMTLLAALFLDVLLVTEPISFSCYSDSHIKDIEETGEKNQPCARSACKYSHVGEGAAKLLTRAFQ